jgi:hypothetical protein
MFFFEGCSLCVLYGGLGITKLQFFIKKISSFFSAVDFFSTFGRQNPGIQNWIRGSATRKKCLIRIRILKQCGSSTTLPTYRSSGSTCSTSSSNVPPSQRTIRTTWSVWTPSGRSYWTASARRIPPSSRRRSRASPGTEFLNGIFSRGFWA